MKKNYMKPTAQVVKVQQQNLLINLSAKNTGLKMGGASTSSGNEDRSRSVGDWDDE